MTLLALPLSILFFEIATRYVMASDKEEPSHDSNIKR